MNSNELKQRDEYYISDRRKIEIKPKDSKTITPELYLPEDTIDLDKWKELYSENKVQFEFVEHDTGKPFKSKEIIIEDILEVKKAEQ